MTDVTLSYSRVDRTYLADSIEKYWSGRTSSNIGIPYLELEEGLIVRGRYLIERKDVLIVDGLGGCMAYVDPDGTISIGWTDKASKSEQKATRALAQVAFEQEQEYCKAQARFLDAKPWEQIIGMTAADGAAHLRSLGW